jgi:hypothetical protein
MNIPRLLLAILVGFLVVFGTDFLIHAVWLAPDYKATQSLWRPDAEMNTHFAWMLLAQFLCAATAIIIWAMGFAGRCLGTGVLFGLIMGMFQEVWAIIFYVVTPIPGDLAVKWYFSGLAQVILIGMVAALLYKPRAATS